MNEVVNAENEICLHFLRTQVADLQGHHSIVEKYALQILVVEVLGEKDKNVFKQQ